MDEKDSIIHQYYLKTKMFSNEISYAASSIDLPVILIESDDKNPQNFTFKKFDTNGQETTPKSFEEIKNEFDTLFTSSICRNSIGNKI